MGVNKFSQYLGGTTYRYFSSAVQYKLVSNLEGKTYLPYTEIIDETSFGGKLTNLAMLGVNTRFGVRTSGPDISWSYNIGLGNPQNSNGSGVAVSKYRGLTVAFVNFTRFSSSSNPAYNAIGITLPGGQKLMFNPSGSKRLSSIAIDDNANTYLAINWGEVDCIDSTGALKWSTKFTVNSFTGSKGDILIKTDNVGYVYVLYACTAWNTNFFNGVRDSFPYTTWYRFHKLRASDGSRVWTKSVPCSYIDFDILSNGRSLCFSGTMRDPSGFYTSISFDGIRVNQQYGSNAYLAFMDSSGNYYKAFNVPVVPSCFAMEPLGNTVYLGGTCKDSTYLPGQSVYSSKRSVFVIAYDSSGNHKWNMMDSTYYPVLSSMQSVAADTSGRIYTAITLNNFYLVDPLCNQADSVIRLVAYDSRLVTIKTPTVATSNFNVINVSSNSISLQWMNGNGANRLIVVRADSAVNQNPLDGASYTANAVFGSGTNLGNGNYVVYSGSGTQTIVTGLQINKRHHFTIFEFNGCFGKERYLYSPLVSITDSVRALSRYYNKRGFRIDSLGSWGMNPDGSGQAPYSFSMNNAFYYLVNDTNCELSGNLTINGYGNIFYIGNQFPVTLTVKSGARLILGETLVDTASAIIVHGVFFSSALTGYIRSKLEINSTQMGSAPLPSFTNVNWYMPVMKLLGKQYYYLPALTVRDTFELDAMVNALVFLEDDTSQADPLRYKSGMVTKMSRMPYKGAQYLYPIGVINTAYSSTGSPIGLTYHYKPATIRFTTPPLRVPSSAGSTYPTTPITMYFYSNWGSNSYPGLPLVDSSVSPSVTIHRSLNLGTGWVAENGSKSMSTVFGITGGVLDITLEDTVTSFLASADAMRICNLTHATLKYQLVGLADTNRFQNGKVVVKCTGGLGGWGPPYSAPNYTSFMRLGIGLDTNYIKHPAARYYNKSGMPIHLRSSWGSNPDGSGDTVLSFNLPNISYHLVNGDSATLTDTLAIKPLGAFFPNYRFFVGDGLRPFTLKIASGGRLELGNINLLMTDSSKLIVNGGFRCKYVNQLAPVYKSEVELNTPDMIDSVVNTDIWYISKLKIRGGHFYKLPNMDIHDSLELDAMVKGTPVLNDGAFGQAHLTHLSGGATSFGHRFYDGQTHAYPIILIDSTASGYVYHNRPVIITSSTTPASPTSYCDDPFIVTCVKDDYYLDLFTGFPLMDTTPASVVTLNKIYETRTMWIGEYGINGNSSCNHMMLGLQVTDTILPQLIDTHAIGLWTYTYNPSAKPIYATGTRTPYSINGNKITAGRSGIKFTWYNPFGAIMFGLVVDSNRAPLPVTWLSFTAQSRQQDVQLDWTTASEINNSHFEIERSADARNFEFAGRVEGNGTTTNINSYLFTDAGAFAKANSDVLYYRLKQVDFNGDFAYSEIRVVRQNEAEVKQSVSAYPNPFSNELFVQLNNADIGCEMRLMDVTGKIWYTLTAKAGLQTIKVNELPVGVYFLQVVGTTATTTIKVTKTY